MESILIAFFIFGWSEKNCKCGEGGGGRKQFCNFQLNYDDSKTCKYRVFRYKAASACPKEFRQFSDFPRTPYVQLHEKKIIGRNFVQSFFASE